MREADGTLLWEATLRTIQDGFSHRPSFADINGDGVRDVLVGTRATRLRTYTGAGEPMWVCRTDDELKAAPIVADLDGDGTTEVIVCSRDGILRLLGAGPHRGDVSNCLY